MFYGGGVLRAYLFAVAGTVVISAILSAIVPQGKLSGAVKTAAKLVCLIVIAQPIADYFVSVKKGENADYFEKNVLSADDDFIKYCSKIKVAAAEQAVEKEIYESYALKVNVEFDWVLCNGSNEVKILTIRLIIDAETAAKERETISNITSDLCEQYGVTVNVQTAADRAET